MFCISYILITLKIVFLKKGDSIAQLLQFLFDKLVGEPWKNYNFFVLNEKSGHVPKKLVWNVSFPTQFWIYLALQGSILRLDPE